MGSKSRRAVQLIFLAAFVLLMVKGRIQLWMAVFLIGLTGAAFFGRFYCGFVCPINTLTEGIDWLYKKRGIKRKEVPEWVKSKAVRFGILLLFLGTMVVTLRTGRKLPVLPILTALGVFITLIYVPSLWHRYLCPYGTLLNITGLFSKNYWRVNEADCKKCGVCERVCPADAVTMNGKDGYPVIDKGFCLGCTTCAETCPTNSIVYTRGRPEAARA